MLVLPSLVSPYGHNQSIRRISTRSTGYGAVVALLLLAFVIHASARTEPNELFSNDPVAVASYSQQTIDLRTGEKPALNVLPADTLNARVVSNGDAGVKLASNSPTSSSIPSSVPSSSSASSPSPPSSPPPIPSLQPLAAQSQQPPEVFDGYVHDPTLVPASLPPRVVRAERSASLSASATAPTTVASSSVDGSSSHSVEMKTQEQQMQQLDAQPSKASPKQRLAATMSHSSTPSVVPSSSSSSSPSSSSSSSSPSPIIPAHSGRVQGPGSISTLSSSSISSTTSTVASKPAAVGIRPTTAYSSAASDPDSVVPLGWLDLILLAFKQLWNAFYIFGAIGQYLPQYLDIRKGKGEAFSPLICLVLSSSNIIRVFYWLGEPFDVVLLYQSLVMILVQTILLEAVCAAKARKFGTELASAASAASASSSVYSQVSFSVPLHKKKRFRDFKLEDFWQWDDFESYMMCLLSLSGVLSVLCFLFNSNKTFVSCLGFTGLLIEASLALPQLYRNYHYSTAGLSRFLIWTWLLGDIAKTAFFLILGAPLPFAFCGAFQVITDALILGQIWRDNWRASQEKAKTSRFAEPFDHLSSAP